LTYSSGLAWRAMAARALRKVAFRGTALTGATAVGVAYYVRVPADHGDHRADPGEGMVTRLYRNFALPAIVYIDPEMAHKLALRSGLVCQALRLLAEPTWTGPSPLDWLLRPPASSTAPSGPSLRQELFGGRLVFDSPVGIAAGFDKDATLVPSYRLGFLPGLGFSEVGSVSALPSEGNERPRCFRLPSDGAVINRMGLNNQGCEAVAERLRSFEVLGRAGNASGRGRLAPVGVNIAKTHSPTIMGDDALQDFSTSFRTLEPFADFMVINVSCPNTAEGKTFEEPETLSALLGTLSRERSQSSTTGEARAPVLVKLCAPPDTQEGRSKLEALVKTSLASGIVDGFVVSNTLPDRDNLLSPEAAELATAAGRGGLSGRPIHKRCVAAIRSVYKQTDGRLPIIGVGGIDSPETAYAAVRAGASLVEVYTGIVYKGPGLLGDIHLGLRRLLERDGFASLAEAVGADSRAPK